MSDNFNLEIIAPDEKIFSSNVKEVLIPSFEGQMTILKDHIPIITFLRPGFVEIKNQNESLKFFIEEGTVEFFNNNLTILSSTILEFNELSREKIFSLIEESKNLLNQDDIDDKKRYIISHKLDCLSKINL